ncbi:ketopantoate reductase family protein [Pseudomaricurvus sp. HS19]|uniref:ketopantoate reductase family protein n=1 Tax=Pseudomaricurvus sp. HS19 TaxID=2692626 RepID=UPI00136CC1F3|nr:2-dehydropantoate 2-reductase N-terminal domain-containing protein [Pseudomaricurvus sp. HS19]MYM63022.1 hypothetical protein [Pseudomaricurvus sp. HS19]
MKTKRILVVGAGALGITTAYHLQLAGADIGFLVRPNREQALSRPQKLYCFNDHSVQTLDGYQVFTDVSQLKGSYFDFVMVTLDGATCRTEEGSTLLKALGKAMANTHSVLLICSVGIGLYDHVRQATGLPAGQILEGTMSMFAYQVDRWTAPLKPTTNTGLHNSADIAYLNHNPGRSFMVTAKPARPAKVFTELFNGCGVARCSTMPVKLYRAFTSAYFCYTTACELTDWRGTDAVINDPELWPLVGRAQREILRLKQHGLAGKLMSWLMTDERLAKTTRQTDTDGEPIGTLAFNHFHHGGKVQAQDIGTVIACADIGEAQGQDMSATRELVNRWRRHSGAAALS